MTIAAGLNIAERLSISEREWGDTFGDIGKAPCGYYGLGVWIEGNRQAGEEVFRPGFGD